MSEQDWRLSASLSCKKYHVLLYRAVVNGEEVYKEVYTPVRRGKFGKSTVVYFIDGDDRRFNSEEELLSVLSVY